MIYVDGSRLSATDIRIVERGILILFRRRRRYIFQPIVIGPMTGKTFASPLTNFAANSKQDLPALFTTNALPLRRPTNMFIRNLYLLKFIDLFPKHAVLWKTTKSFTAAR